jgi:hypothetical protein
MIFTLSHKFLADSHVFIVEKLARYFKNWSQTHYRKLEGIRLTWVWGYRSSINKKVIITIKMNTNNMEHYLNPFLKLGKSDIIDNNFILKFLNET